MIGLAAAATALFFGVAAPSDAEAAVTPFMLKWFWTNQIDRLPSYLRTAVQAQCGLLKWEVAYSRTLVPQHIMATVVCLSRSGRPSPIQVYDITDGKADIYPFTLR